MKRNTPLYNRVLALCPDSATRLLSRGMVSLNIAEQGPSLAWTMWDKPHGRFNVCFLASAVEQMPDDIVTFLWYHELGHVAMGHFAMKGDCARPDKMVSEDIAVNWALRGSKEYIDTLGGIDAEAWLETLGLAPRTYPLYVIHDLLHEAVDNGCAGGEGEGYCGGIEQTDDPRAVARGIIANGSLKGDERYAGRLAGTEAGNLGISLTDSPLPPWLSAVERFARSVVDMQLAERRTHKRAQPTLKSAGVHVPSMRPAWAPVPSTLCLLVDTSGSMLGDLHYVAPVLSYLKQHGVTTRLIAGDTQVTFDEVITRIPEEIKGGGGTDVIPLFQRAYDYKPRALVLFSDGFVSAWPHDPEMPVLFVGLQTEGPGYGVAA